MSVNPVINKVLKMSYKDMGQKGFQGVKQDDVNCGHLNPVQRSC